MKKEEIKELSIQELRDQIVVAEKAYRELKVTHAKIGRASCRERV